MVKELFNSFIHPWEIKAMLNLKFKEKIQHPKQPLEELIEGLGDRDFCYTALTKVSRSFAVVIQQLPEDLKDPVCVFYLVLRGLDSIEDDMDFAQEPKLELLRSFYQKRMIYHQYQ
jgi:farnesyl-diphosphate farnesyltransferase